MEAFDAFWAVFPRRQAKADALKAWKKLNPSAELVAQIMAAIEWQSQSQAWLKDGGQYVPLPGSWIRGERWTDERADRRELNRHVGTPVRGESEEMTAYRLWREKGCPHTPTCPHFTACWLVSLRKAAS